MMCYKFDQIRVSSSNITTAIFARAGEESFEDR